MNYFTKNELEDITKELMENPTRETLNKLNEKYNGSNEVELANPVPTVVEPVQAPVVNMDVPVNKIQNLSIPNFELPKVEDNTLNNGVKELPRVEMPIMENQNNEPINFDGNLFVQTNTPNMENMMQTTQNFNNVPNTMPTTEVQVSTQPFFGTNQGFTNNPIQVNGPVNNVPVAPSMFGQFEQNYM